MYLYFVYPVWKTNKSLTNYAKRAAGSTWSMSDNLWSLDMDLLLRIVDYCRLISTF